MPTLDRSLSAEQSVKFQQLQGQLRSRAASQEPVCQETLCDGPGDNILVIPSLSVDLRELVKIHGFLHYEERLLFSLARLQNPKNRIIYVTSEPIHPSVIDYYLQLLPGIPVADARDRLLLFSTYDSSLKPLSQKILERPRLMARIHQALRSQQSYMICYNSTDLERQISVALEVPLYGLDPDLLHWGTKSGSRRIFAECGVPFPDGSELVWNGQDLAKVTAALWERQPSLKRIVIKLNEGFSGEGNALLNLTSLQSVAPGNGSHDVRVARIQEQFEWLRFQAPDETWASFSSRIPELGAIAEAFIEGKETRSPSVQGRIAPSGEVEILSTHDQILGGPDGQIYLGCRFPADAAYRLQLQTLGMQIGQNLASKGALERFSVDFLAVCPSSQLDPSAWDLQAIEINLRQGGTTHPFMTLKFMTNGDYDLASGLFYSQQGCPKYYIATDNLQKDQYRGLLPNDLMEIITHHHLHLDTQTETGTLFHLLGCLSEFGKLGLTCIGNSPQQAEEIYNTIIQVLDQETQSAAIPKN
ncbi:MAG: peptide ligase PGM1-related protein [Leptolyngbyaceae bacterium]|nr:peptide ligase PGM1-related protein [Leptolyngbyaceae bacterium]